MKRAVWMCLWGCLVYGQQQPTVSNIVVDDLDTTSFHLFFNVSGVSGAWSEVFYGTQSGIYPYNTKSISCYNRIDPCQASGITALTVTGLKPGTTYYVLPTARPHPDDDVAICNTAACGAVEQVITTPAGPQPSPPRPPMTWVPPLPDTTNYALIPLQVGSTGECQAAQTVSADGWTVPSGTYLGAALNIVGYGVVFEIPQGVACKIPQGVMGDPSKGYVLPAKPLDNNCGGVCSMTDPRHRWIVFRTKQVQATDFPPFGARITPDYAPLLGKFYSSQPNAASQLFDAENGTNSVHHFWFQNVEFEDDPAYSNPVDSVDPTAFTFFGRLGSSYQNQNNQFLVLDRVYTHGPGAPIRQEYGFELGGNYIAMVGCYTAHIESWRLTAWPTTLGSLNTGNNILTIPQNNYRYARSSPLLGMSGPATAALNGIVGSGTVVGNLYKDHLEIQYTAGIGSILCTGCTATPTSSPSTPQTALRLFAGTITSAGQFSGLNWNTQEYQTSKYALAFGVVTSDLKANGGPYDFDNNYLDGLGEGFYMDPQASPYSNDDLTYIHNHHIWPKQYYTNDPGNQWRYEVRQHWESKRVHRALLKGNVFSYSWSFQNDDPAIFLSSRSPYAIQAGNNDGISDVTVESNLISHGRSGIECENGNTLDNGGTLAEPRAAKRFRFVNNLMFDLGRWKYCDPEFCPGLQSAYFQNRPGCQDLVIENNTAGPTYGEVPSFLLLGGGQELGNYLSFRKNILYFSKGLSGYGGGNFGDWPPNNVQNHNVEPTVVYDNNGAAPNFKANLDASFVNTAATVTPNYSWGQNVLIGGWKDTNGTLAGIVDLTFSEVQAYAAHMPSGDYYPQGNTIAARESQLHLANPGAFDFRVTRASAYSPGGIGVDYEKLYSDLGLVTQIEKPEVSAAAVKFRYRAPDSRACVVDVGQSGVWTTRQSDSGGARGRTVVMGNLQPGTDYQYRILCYYKQVNDGVLYTDYTPDEITNGAFSTAVSQNGQAQVPFALNTVAHAAQVRVTLTPVTGAPVSQTCSASPCQVPATDGDYALKVEYLSAGGSTLSSGGGQISVR